MSKIVEIIEAVRRNPGMILSIVAEDYPPDDIQDAYYSEKFFRVVEGFRCVVGDIPVEMRDEVEWLISRVGGFVCSSCGESYGAVKERVADRGRVLCVECYVETKGVA